MPATADADATLMTDAAHGENFWRETSHLSSQQKPMVTQSRESSLVHFQHMKLFLVQRELAHLRKGWPIKHSQEVLIANEIYLHKSKGFSEPGLCPNCEREWSKKEDCCRNSVDLKENHYGSSHENTACATLNVLKIQIGFTWKSKLIPDLYSIKNTIGRLKLKLRKSLLTNRWPSSLAAATCLVGINLKETM